MKSRMMLLGLASFALTSAVAVEVTLKTGDAAGFTSWNTGSHWSDGAAPSAGKAYVVSDSLSLRTPNDVACPKFAGDSLTFINGGGLSLKHSNGGAAECALWKMYDCSVSVSWGDASYILIGNRMEIGGTAAAPTCFCVSCSPRDASKKLGRKLWIKAPLYGDENAVIRVHKTADIADLTECVDPARVKFAADNTNYKGRFVIVRTNPSTPAGLADNYVLDFGKDDIYATQKGSTMCMGTGVDSGAYLTMGDKTVLYARGLAFTERYPLSLEGDVRFGLCKCGVSALSGRRSNEALLFDKGVTITGGGASVITVRVMESGAGALALGNVAITGVAKMVMGENVIFRVYPGYDNPTVSLETSCIIADEADGLGPVTLKRGGYLSPGYGTSGVGVLGMASLAMEAGSYFICSVAPSGSGVTNDFVKVNGDLVNRTGGKIKICFDTPYTGLKPQDKITLLSAANLGEQGVGADDFEIDNDAWNSGDRITLNPFEGTFSIEERAEGNSLVFTYTGREVVKLIGQDVKGHSCFAASSSSVSTYWSNSQKPAATCDYLLPNGTLLRINRDDGKEHVFAGHSLTMLSGATMGLDLTRATIGDLRLYGGAKIDARDQWTENNGQELTCHATVMATQENPVLIQNSRVGNGNPERMLTFRENGTLGGWGDLRFYNDEGTADMEPQNCTYVKWDASAFTGGIQITGRCSKVFFKDEKAMGGPATSFRSDRLRLEGDGKLFVNGGYTMSDPTRGITIGGGHTVTGGTIWVNSGPLVVSNIISGTTVLRKLGPATLRLCCPSNTFSGQVAHKVGKLAIAHKDTLARAKTLQCYPDGVWHIEDLEGMTVSSKNAFVRDGQSENVRFRIYLAAFENITGATSRLRAPIWRVKGATEADAEAIKNWIALENAPRRWDTWLETEVANGELVVYAVAERKGTLVIVR